MGESIDSGRRCGRRLVRFTLTCFGRDRNGTTAIEFAILSIPFCLLLCGVLESCISFAAQQVLTNIADDVARQVRTGELKGLTKATLRQTVCGQLEIIVAKDCPGLDIDLRSFDTFEKAADEAKLIYKNGDVDTGKFDVTPGGPLTINMLRVIYRWPVMTDLLALQMSPLDNKKILHFTTSTWRNEPFDE